MVRQLGYRFIADESSGYNFAEGLTTLKMRKARQRLTA